MICCRSDVSLALSSSFFLIAGLQDVCMPVMDGLEATRRIRRYELTGSWEDLREGKTNKLADASSCDQSPPVDFHNTPSLASQALLRKRTPIIAVSFMHSLLNHNTVCGKVVALLEPILSIGLLPLHFIECN